MLVTNASKGWDSENFAPVLMLSVLKRTLVHIDCFVPVALERETRSRGVARRRVDTLEGKSVP